MCCYFKQNKTYLKNTGSNEHLTKNLSERFMVLSYFWGYYKKKKLSCYGRK